MTELEYLTPQLRAQVNELIERIEAHDGVRPVNEAAELAISGHRKANFYLESAAGQIIGFSIADARDKTIVAGVDPEHRGHDVAEAVVGAALADQPGYTVWAFGTLPGRELLAKRLGLHPVRKLLKLSRQLPQPQPVELPAGYRIESYTPADAEAIVNCNGLAFAEHPEQGKLSLADFRILTEQPWFDPNGLLLARTQDQLAGFHWTKQHDATTGEVYVIAVAPGYEGQGLGRALLTAGLNHLKALGCEQVQLYVEADASRAVELYKMAGFTQLSLDTGFRLEL